MTITAITKANMNTYKVKVTDTVTVELTAKQFADLHDRLTKAYNEHYDDIESWRQDTTDDYHPKV